MLLYITYYHIVTYCMYILHTYIYVYIYMYACNIYSCF